MAWREKYLTDAGSSRYRVAYRLGDGRKRSKTFPLGVVVVDIDAEDMFDVMAVEDQQPVEALGAEIGARDGARSGSLCGCSVCVRG
jgi:hypothetical protein